MRKPEPKKRRPVIARKPNAVIYAIANALISLFLKVVFRFRADLTQIRELRPPYLLLCNHSCNIDFLITAAAMYPQKLNFMSAALYFQNPLLAWLLTLMGCFPKQQFVSDVQSVRNIMRVLGRGDVPVLFPAGQSSFTGQDTLIDPSIAKLLRLARVPVVALHTTGAHMGFPKWNMKGFRPSRVESRAWQLFSAEELGRLDDEAIYRRVVEGLAFDDYEWQKQRRIAARKPRKAEGLEQLLFLCPGCGQEFAMTAKGSRLWCGHCGYAAEMDEYGLLAPAKGQQTAFDTPTAWWRWQTEEYRKRLLPGFAYAEPVRLLRIAENGKLFPVGQGEARLTLDALNVTGTVDGQTADWVIDNSLSGVFPHEKKTCFEVMVDGQLYAIAPENPRAVFKFILLKDLLFRRLRPETEGGGPIPRPQQAP